MKLYELHEQINAICPIYSISSDGRIDFKEQATEDQKQLAMELMTNKKADIELPN